MSIRPRPMNGIAVLVLLAFALRCSLPAGTMLERPFAGDTAPRVVLCTAAGMVEIAAGADFGVPSREDRGPLDDGGMPDDGGKGPCLYSGAAVQLASAPPAIVPDRPVESVPGTGPGFDCQRPGERLAAPPPPATGPPSHA